VVSYRGLCSLTLGIWLGAAIFADVAVTQNFQTVDRFLSSTGQVAGTGRTAGRTAERALLRRNAAEENAWIFENWERVELVLGAALFVFLLQDNASRKLWPGLCLAMIAMVAAEHFFLTESINELGRRIDDLPATDPLVRRFWIMHGLYSGLDLLKLAVGFGLAAGLNFQRKLRPAGEGETAGIGHKTGLMARG